jgi:hypothetical protein
MKINLLYCKKKEGEKQKTDTPAFFQCVTDVFQKCVTDLPALVRSKLVYTR